MGLPPMDEQYDSEPDSVASNSELDSAFGDDVSTISTESIRSSIMRAWEENGRKYTAYREGNYLLPIDKEELDRQDFQYQLCLETFDRTLAFAPITRPHRVLDAGCGLGFWAMDFAEQHPESQVLGVDLSAVQAPYVEPNVQFEIDDLEEEWTFSFKFDYVHCLMMTGAFKDWPKFFGQAFDNLNKDGWIELQDIDFPLKSDDGTLREDSALNQWSELMVRAGRESGYLLDSCHMAADQLRAAGFVDVVRVPYRWPINGWPADMKSRRIGIFTEHNFTIGMESITMALFTRFMGWNKEQVLEFSERVKRELRDMSIHAYFDIYVTYGRKP